MTKESWLNLIRTYWICYCLVWSLYKSAMSWPRSFHNTNNGRNYIQNHYFIDKCMVLLLRKTAIQKDHVFNETIIFWYSFFSIAVCVISRLLVVFNLIDKYGVASRIRDILFQWTQLFSNLCRCEILLVMFSWRS